MSEDLPTLDRPRIANSGRSCFGQSLALALLFTNSTSLILASPAYGPSTMFEPGRTIFSVTSSAGSTPGDMNRTFLSRIVELALAFGARTWRFGFGFWLGWVGFERRVRKERVEGWVLIGGERGSDKKEVICRVRRRFLSNIVWVQERFYFVRL